MEKVPLKDPVLNCYVVVKSKRDGPCDGDSMIYAFLSCTAQRPISAVMTRVDTVGIGKQPNHGGYRTLSIYIKPSKFSRVSFDNTLKSGQSSAHYVSTT